MVGHSADSTKRLRGLRVSHDLTIGGVNSREILILAFADFKGSILSIVRGVVRATNTVIDVLTVPCGISTDTSSEAEFGVGDEGSPFVVLNGLASCTKGGTENKTTN